MTLSFRYTNQQIEKLKELSDLKWSGPMPCHFLSLLETQFSFEQKGQIEELLTLGITLDQILQLATLKLDSFGSIIYPEKVVSLHGKVAMDRSNVQEGEEVCHHRFIFKDLVKTIPALASFHCQATIQAYERKDSEATYALAADHHAISNIGALYGDGKVSFSILYLPSQLTIFQKIACQWIKQYWNEAPEVLQFARRDQEGIQQGRPFSHIRDQEFDDMTRLENQKQRKFLK